MKAQRSKMEKYLRGDIDVIVGYNMFNVGFNCPTAKAPPDPSPFP